MLKLYGWTCQICGEPIDPDLPENHPRSLTVDHIVPVGVGGIKGRSNRQPAHRDCNMRKANRPSASNDVPPRGGRKEVEG